MDVYKRIFAMQLLLIITSILIACGNVTEDEKGTGTGTSETNVEELIGKSITISDDGSITLPHENVVIDAYYSGDGRVKLFNTLDEVLIIDGVEIVYAEEGSTAYNLPAVSDDGRFVAWFSEYSGDGPTISFYDLQEERAEIIESDKVTGELNVSDQMVIKQIDDFYYLLSNLEQDGLPPLMVVELTTKEVYERDAGEIIEKLTPEKPVLDDERYHDYQAKARQILEPVSKKWGYTYEKAGYYQLFYNVEEDSEEEYIRYVINLYGFNAHDSSNVPIEISTENFTLDESETEIREEDMRVADETGFAIIPMFQKEFNESYQLSVYSTNLSHSNPELALVTEEEVATSNRERPRVVLNHDGSGFYLTNIDGTMNFFELKNFDAQ